MTRDLSRREFVRRAVRTCGGVALGAGALELVGCGGRTPVEDCAALLQRVKARHRELGGLPDNPVTLVQSPRDVLYPYVGDPTDYDYLRNAGYALVKEALMLLNPDIPENPLGNIVRPGDRVVIKPNWCTQLIFPIPITHPSLVHAVAELAAQAGAASVRIVEGPMTMSYSATWYYGPSFINIEPWLRYISEKFPDTLFSHQDANADEFLWIDLSSDSLLRELPVDVLCHDGGPICRDMFFDVEDSRGVNPREYTAGLYAIAKSYLESDVFINFPKMKTHHWTAITIALKNLMGLNLMSTVHRMPDDQFKQYMARVDCKEWRECGMRDVPHFDGRYCTLHTRQTYSRKNDVLWRSLADLNRVIRYADEQGRLQRTPQRRYLNIVDGIVGTDGDGPIARSRVYSRTIVAGADPVRVDAVCARVMGYEPTAIKLIRDSSAQTADLPIGDMRDYESSIVSCESIGRIPQVYHYDPPSSWLPTADHNIFHAGGVARKLNHGEKSSRG